MSIPAGNEAADIGKQTPLPLFPTALVWVAKPAGWPLPRRRIAGRMPTVAPSCVLA